MKKTGYKLKSSVIYQINGYDKEKKESVIKKALGMALNRSIFSIKSYLKLNEVNGELTKYSALVIILAYIDCDSFADLLEEVK